MIATGMLFTAKARPSVHLAKDGAFSMIFLAYDRLGTHNTVAWRISYFGAPAKAFWATAANALCTPGQPLWVEVRAIHTFSAGRFSHPEIHAEASTIALALHANHKAMQSPPDVRVQVLH